MPFWAKKGWKPDDEERELSQKEIKTFDIPEAGTKQEREVSVVSGPGIGTGPRMPA